VQGWDSPRTERKLLRQRWEDLNKAVRRLWDICDLVPTGQYFSLTLQSHLAMRDKAGQPLLGNIGPVDFKFPAEVERCRSVLNAVAVPGWNAVLGLPKADIWALSRGSVLLLRLPLQTDPGPTLARLAELEQDGGGEHRSEGFGRMIACDPFHSYFTLRDLQGGL
jgi:hypothetical protein